MCARLLCYAQRTAMRLMARTTGWQFILAHRQLIILRSVVFTRPLYYTFIRIEGEG